MSCDPTKNGFEGSGQESDYIQNQSGQTVTKVTMDEGVMTWNYTDVYADGQLFATYDAQGLHFQLNDWLGTRRVTTNYAGVVEQTCTNLPYGGAESCGPDPGGYVYARLQQDSTASMDNAMHRQYGSFYGRWTTPDPYSGSYDINDPQSLNRYSYAGNSPFMESDPSGLDSDCFIPAYGGPVTCNISWGSVVAPIGLNSSSLTGLIGGIPGVGGLLATSLTAAGPLYAFGDGIYNLGKDFGWWGGGPSFHGNVAASQSGKDVPGASPANVPGPAVSGDVPIDNPWGQAAFGPQSASTWNAAAWAVSPQGIATWYGASAVGAVGALGVANAGIAQVAIGTTDSGSLHFAVGVDGAWMHGTNLFAEDGMEMTSQFARGWAKEAFRIPVPVLNPGAVLPEEGTAVYNCFTGVCSAILRGWLP